MVSRQLKYSIPHCLPASVRPWLASPVPTAYLNFFSFAYQYCTVVNGTEMRRVAVLWAFLLPVHPLTGYRWQFRCLRHRPGCKRRRRRRSCRCCCCASRRHRYCCCTRRLHPIATPQNREREKRKNKKLFNFIIHT